jgi:carboxymethylenebutenolidase
MNTEPLGVTTQTATDGFSQATHPIAQTTIHTPSAGLHTGDVLIRSQGEELPAYFARPAPRQGKLPVILVVQEIFGVHEYIRDVCRRLAHEGYFAIAPELYFRQGDASQYSDITLLLKELVSQVPDQQVLADLDHTAHWAASQGGDVHKLAITGFCWGGRISWLYAAHNPQVKAAIAWYGKLMADKTLCTPSHPVDQAKNLCAPVLGLYGGQDSGIPLSTVEMMRQMLRAANADAEIIVYPEAGHAFHADYRPSYQAEAAQDGWQRMLNWLSLYGVE